ncbi:hypothetical protein BGZ60DRAFT_152780 [Tricladium varicosporioides]|nr:hypothetical protein BGZ60DRAFT_152780 [Hymenoscyphus varicosporioides]
MAPGYRNQNRRQNRTAVDHDIFEGLPVPQWRREPVTVAPPPTQESTTIQNDIWAVELPHGMPKDSHLLPQHSQDLLRAARSGKIYKRPLPVEEEEADAEAILGDKPEKKDDETKDRGFVARAWKRIPRHMEGPDQNYLAPRRKGLITATSKPPAAGPTLTKATVRRTDAAGNEYVQDVVVPHGQAVEGEVIAQTVIPDPAAAPVDAYAVQPTPPRRKGPVSKKKKKSGPGRGKKKNMAPTSVPQALPADGSAPVSHATAGAVDAETNSGTATSAQTNEDTEMGEGSNAASDDDDGSDGGSGDEDEGSIDTQNSPSKPPRHSQSPTPTSLPSMRDIPDSLAPPAIPAIFPPHLEREKSEGKLGSPLKNVALSTSALSTPLTSPTETAPPMLSSSALPMPSLQEKVKVLETESIDEILQDQTSAIAPPTLPLPEPTQAEESASQQLRKEEEAEEMLLDIVEGVNAPSTIVSPPATVSTPTGMNEKSVSALEPEVAPKTPQAEVAKDVEIEKKAEDDDDDNFPDLLGGLEKSLATPERKALG